jgi:hypothetical protein
MLCDVISAVTEFMANSATALMTSRTLSYRCYHTSCRNTEGKTCEEGCVVDEEPAVADRAASDQRYMHCCRKCVSDSAGAGGSNPAPNSKAADEIEAFAAAAAAMEGLLECAAPCLALDYT